MDEDEVDTLDDFFLVASLEALDSIWMEDAIEGVLKSFEEKSIKNLSRKKIAKVKSGNS